VRTTPSKAPAIFLLQRIGPMTDRWGGVLVVPDSRAQDRTSPLAELRSRTQSL